MGVGKPPLPDWLIGILGGGTWPEGDEDAVRALAGMWSSAADELHDAIGDAVTGWSALLQAYPTKGGQGMVNAVVDYDLNVRNTVEEGMRQLAATTIEDANQIEYTKLQILFTLIMSVAVLAGGLFIGLATRVGAALARQLIFNIIKAELRGLMEGSLARAAALRAPAVAELKAVIIYGARALGERAAEQFTLKGLGKDLVLESVHEVSDELSADVPSQLIMIGEGHGTGADGHGWNWQNTGASALGAVAGVPVAMAAGGLLNLAGRGVKHVIPGPPADSIAAKSLGFAWRATSDFAVNASTSPLGSAIGNLPYTGWQNPYTSWSDVAQMGLHGVARGTGGHAFNAFGSGVNTGVRRVFGLPDPRAVVAAAGTVDLGAAGAAPPAVTSPAVAAPPATTGAPVTTSTPTSGAPSVSGTAAGSPAGAPASPAPAAVVPTTSAIATPGASTTTGTTTSTVVSPPNTAAPTSTGTPPPSAATSTSGAPTTSPSAAPAASTSPTNSSPTNSSPTNPPADPAAAQRVAQRAAVSSVPLGDGAAPAASVDPGPGRATIALAPEVHGTAAEHALGAAVHDLTQASAPPPARTAGTTVAGSGARLGPQPDRVAQAASDPATHATGLSVDDVHAAIKWTAPRGVEVHVLADTGELEAAYGSAAATVRGAYLPEHRRIVLVASNLADAAEARTVLAHELVGHVGLDVLGQDAKQELLRRIAATRDDPRFAALWQQADGHGYPGGGNEAARAEEVFALVAQDTPPALRRWWDRFLSRHVLPALRAVNLLGPRVTMAELRAVAAGLAGSLAADGVPDSLPHTGPVRFDAGHGPAPQPSAADRARARAGARELARERFIVAAAAGLAAITPTGADAAGDPVFEIRLGNGTTATVTIRAGRPVSGADSESTIDGSGRAVIMLSGGIARRGVVEETVDHLARIRARLGGEPMSATDALTQASTSLDELSAADHGLIARLLLARRMSAQSRFRELATRHGLAPGQSESWGKRARLPADLHRDVAALRPRIRDLLTERVNDGYDDLPSYGVTLARKYLDALPGLAGVPAFEYFGLHALAMTITVGAAVGPPVVAYFTRRAATDLTQSYLTDDAWYGRLAGVFLSDARTGMLDPLWAAMVAQHEALEALLPPAPPADPTGRAEVVPPVQGPRPDRLPTSRRYSKEQAAQLAALLAAGGVVGLDPTSMAGLAAALLVGPFTTKFAERYYRTKLRPYDRGRPEHDTAHIHRRELVANEAEALRAAAALNALGDIILRGLAAAGHGTPEGLIIDELQTVFPQPPPDEVRPGIPGVRAHAMRELMERLGPLGRSLPGPLLALATGQLTLLYASLLRTLGPVTLAGVIEEHLQNLEGQAYDKVILSTLEALGLAAQQDLRGRGDDVARQVQDMITELRRALTAVEGGPGTPPSLPVIEAQGERHGQEVQWPTPPRVTPHTEALLPGYRYQYGAAAIALAGLATAGGAFAIDPSSLLPVVLGIIGVATAPATALTRRWFQGRWLAADRGYIDRSFEAGAQESEAARRALVRFVTETAHAHAGEIGRALTGAPAAGTPAAPVPDGTLAGRVRAFVRAEREALQRNPRGTTATPWAGFAGRLVALERLDRLAALIDAHAADGDVRRLAADVGALSDLADAYAKLLRHEVGLDASDVPAIDPLHPTTAASATVDQDATGEVAVVDRAVVAALVVKRAAAARMAGAATTELTAAEPLHPDVLGRTHEHVAAEVAARLGVPAVEATVGDVPAPPRVRFADGTVHAIVDSDEQLSRIEPGLDRVVEPIRQALNRALVRSGGRPMTLAQIGTMITHAMRPGWVRESVVSRIRAVRGAAGLDAGQRVDVPIDAARAERMLDNSPDAEPAVLPAGVVTRSRDGLAASGYAVRHAVAGDLPAPFGPRFGGRFAAGPAETGFVAGGGRFAPAYWLDTGQVTEGDTLWHVGADGSRRLVGRFTGGAWARVADPDGVDPDAVAPATGLADELRSAAAAIDPLSGRAAWRITLGNYATRIDDAAEQARRSGDLAPLTELVQALSESVRHHAERVAGELSPAERDALDAMDPLGPQSVARPAQADPGTSELQVLDRAVLAALGVEAREFAAGPLVEAGVRAIEQQTPRPVAQLLAIRDFLLRVTARVALAERADAVPARLAWLLRADAGQVIARVSAEATGRFAADETPGWLERIPGLGRVLHDLPVAPETPPGRPDHTAPNPAPLADGSVHSPRFTASRVAHRDPSHREASAPTIGELNRQDPRRGLTFARARELARAPGPLTPDEVAQLAAFRDGLPVTSRTTLQLEVPATELDSTTGRLAGTVTRAVDRDPAPGEHVVRFFAGSDRPVARGFAADGTPTFELDERALPQGAELYRVAADGELVLVGVHRNGAWVSTADPAGVQPGLPFATDFAGRLRAAFPTGAFARLADHLDVLADDARRTDDLAPLTEALAELSRRIRYRIGHLAPGDPGRDVLVDLDPLEPTRLWTRPAQPDPLPLGGRRPRMDVIQRAVVAALFVRALEPQLHRAKVESVARAIDDAMIGAQDPFSSDDLGHTLAELALGRATDLDADPRIDADLRLHEGVAALLGDPPTGPPPAGGPPTGGPDPTGPDPVGPAPTGPDPVGPDPAGPAPAGPAPAGPPPARGTLAVAGLAGAAGIALLGGTTRFIHLSIWPWPEPPGPAPSLPGIPTVPAPGPPPPAGPPA